jgi:hypothetical protein
MTCISRLKAVEASLLEIKDLLALPRRDNAVAEVGATAIVPRSLSPTSDAYEDIEDDERTPQRSSSAVVTPAVEKVRAAPINIVRDMKHHILGTNPRVGASTHSQAENAVEARVITPGLHDTLLNR